MGNYFFMSTRFNKRTAQDFGLEPTQDGFAKNPTDGSVWEKIQLFDLGWGRENGYYRLPILPFEELYALVVQSQDDEDSYGAAAMILDRHADRLLEQCERLIGDPSGSAELDRLNRFFRLEVPVNRCSIRNKTHNEICADHERWKKVAQSVRTRSKSS